MAVAGFILGVGAAGTSLLVLLVYPLYGALNTLVGVAVPFVTRRVGPGPWPQSTVDLMCGLWLACGLLLLGVTWFGMRAGHSWALWLAAGTMAAQLAGWIAYVDEMHDYAFVQRFQPAGPVSARDDEAAPLPATTSTAIIERAADKPRKLRMTHLPQGQSRTLRMANANASPHRGFRRCVLRRTLRRQRTLAQHRVLPPERRSRRARSNQGQVDDAG